MYHKIIIVGHLGRDPEMRYTPNGQAVTSFSVATSRSYLNASGERVDETIWFRVSVWGKQAETCNNFLRKGRKVLVEGTLIPDASSGSPRLFQRKDGTVGTSYEVRAQTVKFLDSRAEAEAGGEDMSAIAEDFGDDAIPF